MMKPRFLTTILFSTVLIVAGSAMGQSGKLLTQDSTCDLSGDCGEFGTTLKFAESPAAAAKQANEEEKLVFVLHVSGNFETSEYT